MVIKLFSIFTVFTLTICSYTVLGLAIVGNSKSKNIGQPACTLPVQTKLSQCSQKRTVGLSPGINIPQALCFDVSKPVDAKEKSSAKIGNSTQSSQIEDSDISFAKLPKEVQNIVRLTVPEMDTPAVVFDLTIVPTPDAKANNRMVKSYSYGSSSKNKAAGKDPNHHSWLFKRQNNLLKLEYAEIDTTK